MRGAMKNYFKPAIILIIIFFSISVQARDPLTGPSFTDPSEVFKMPPDWVKKPIKYEDWAEGSDLAVTLEQDVYHMILPLIRQFEKKKGIRIAVKEGTCGISAGMLSRKTVDIGGYCCPGGKEDRLPGLKFHTLAIVAEAFFVHPENSVDDLSISEIRSIFQGKIQLWSELQTREGNPGPSWAIKPVGRFHCPLRPGHWRLLLDKEDLYSSGLYEVGSMPDMIASVAANKGAIGWETLGMIRHYRNIGKVTPLRINGHLPSDTAALAEKRYPFYRAYNLTLWEGENIGNPRAKELVEYLVKAVEEIDPAGFGIVPASKLRKAGWKFRDGELVGEPELK
jgi:phosphate transport system substrate-binding protein